MIIAVMNQKGGVGKSTLSINLCATAALEGLRPLLIDADVQQTSQDWASLRDGGTPFPIVGMTRATLHTDAKALEADYDLIIIDGAPRNYSVARSAIIGADMVIIPVRPSPADLWASKETVDLVKEARELKPSHRAAFLFTCRVKRSRMNDRIRPSLESYGLPIMDAGTTLLQTYAETMIIGETVFEGDKDGPAPAEMRAIWEEVKGIMNEAS